MIREDKFYIDDFSEYKVYNFVTSLIFEIILQYNFIKKKAKLAEAHIFLLKIQDGIVLLE